MRVKLAEVQLPTKDQFGWYRHFVVRPRIIHNNIVWLEWVERREHPFGKRDLDGVKREYRNE